MRVPESLATLAEFGVIEEVLRPLMSGKEAQVYLVVTAGRECIAKVYKKAQARAFKNRAEYTEGRGARRSRDQRAMAKRSSWGRELNEEAWHSTEVDMLRLLHRAGVRVPTPLRYMDGVLVMELITDAEGNPAPQLGHVELPPAEAQAVYDRLLRDVIRMLCAGVVHGDLSDFNVLLAADGPVIIDLPQAVNASKNPHARKMLIRDVDNLHRFLGRHVPNARICRYAEEMWELWEKDELTPDTQLTGEFVASDRIVDTDLVLDLIDDAEHDERRRLEGLGLPTSRMPMPRRRERPAPPRGGAGGGGGAQRRPNAPPAKEKPGPPVTPAPPRKGPDAPGSKARIAAMMKAVEKGGPAALAPKPKPAPPPAAPHVAKHPPSPARPAPAQPRAPAPPPRPHSQHSRPPAPPPPPRHPSPPARPPAPASPAPEGSRQPGAARKRRRRRR